MIKSNTADIQGLPDILSREIFKHLFPPHLEPVPQLNEVYELGLASCESRMLSDEEIIRNGAYFARVGDVLTRHFLMCSGEPVRLPHHSSSRLRSFFQSNQFKTGYATHGLFPYRGKFHPQMIKGLINIMGVKPGNIILDPMMGSGTVLIEACLMGIKSVGIDASPFCRFIAQAKVDALTMPLKPVYAALTDWKSVFEHFRALVGQPRQGSKMRVEARRGGLLPLMQPEAEPAKDRLSRGKLPPGCQGTEIYNFLLLAYLDSAGYSQRSDRKSPDEQFRAILERYSFVAEKIQRVLAGTEAEMGTARPLEGDARCLPLEDGSIDGVLFSPPYSFAIDYLENDSFHLRFLGVEIEELREKMIGLRGRTLQQQFEMYKADMDKVLGECARVLRRGRMCTIVVGTNNNQLSKILGISPDEVQGIHGMLVEVGTRHGLEPVGKIERRITGMANTMRSEFILMLQRI